MVFTASTLESMDFEEVESRQWLKVYISLSLLCTWAILLITSHCYCVAPTVPLLPKQREVFFRHPHDDGMEMDLASTFGSRDGVSGWFMIDGLVSWKYGVVLEL